MNYIQSIGEAGGFIVETEVRFDHFLLVAYELSQPLRIPSTKNMALIGRKLSYDPKDPAAVKAMTEKREKLLENKQVATMKLRTEREAEHRDSRKRRRDNVLAAARDRCGGGTTEHSHDESDEAVEEDQLR